jgi:hypothetical protein
MKELSAKKMGAIKNDISGRCGAKRGCHVDYDMPYDRKPELVYSGMLPKRDDIQALLPMVDAMVGTLAQER